MRSLRTIFILLFSVCVFQTYSQLSGIRVGINSGVFVNELGASDVPHPTALMLSPATSSEKFKNDPGFGAELEVIFDVAPKSKVGIETEYIQLKGTNDNPPYFNYYLTPYFGNYQSGFTGAPVAYNTSLINVSVNWKYFPFIEQQIKPFVKIGGVVSFIATDFTINDEALSPPANLLYARGTSNSEQSFWPAFHVAIGGGFTYDFNNRWALQADVTATVIYSDIINGAPNFTYNVSKDVLEHNRQLSLMAQAAFSIIYKIDPNQGQSGPRGRTSKALPFFRKK